ncbi:MAG: outer membrane protein assembly factor BamA, partial [Bdellovibrionales bacterium]|nr:outer membrane protein assembly factor BamA [Bdellovibrionales bacterium]
ALNDIFIEPTAETNLVFSGELELLQTSQGRTGLTGKLKIENGELQKQVDFVSLLRNLLNLLFQSGEVKREATSLPNIDLNIEIDATRNLFIFTNWLGAELRAALTIAGTFSNPQILGKLETLAGWFGFKDRRFEITSGEIHFRPGQLEPTLEMISEAFVRTSIGDSVLVLLEATGPLTAPKITLTSDSGLSERQILTLLTSSSNVAPGISNQDSRSGIELGEIALLRDETAMNIDKLFNTISSIDSLVLEPTYNPLSGVIEPTLIATKRITDNLSLVGETFFGREENQANIRILYNFTPLLRMSGIAESVNTEDNTAFGVDLSYTVWEQSKKYLNIEIAGNNNFPRSNLLRTLRIGENSFLNSEDVDALHQELQKAYAAKGYFSSSSSFSCVEADQHCALLRISIKEGARHRISQMVFEGDQVAPEIERRMRDLLSRDTYATDTVLISLRDDLIRQLRSEGFIGTRVTASYTPAPNKKNSQNLHFEVSLGQPVSFIFKGNSHFSAEDFLETINLFKRRQPFGNNTINILIQSIERKYRENGYLFAAIQYTRSQSEDNRVYYEIDIDEGPEIRVSEINFLQTELTPIELKELVRKYNSELADSLFTSEFAVAEELEVNSKLLKEIYVQEGYPQAEIDFTIDVANDSKFAIVTYEIKPGPRTSFDTMRIEGLPKHLQYQSKEQAPFSIPDINQQIDILMAQLRDAGYLHPAMYLEQNASNKEILLKVTAGERTEIEAISIEGNSNVSRDVILERFKVKAGDYWDEQALAEGKSRLLKLGLFSRVQIDPADGQLDQSSEKLVLRVSERPLRTLEIGAGVNSEYGVHIFGEASDKELFGDGRSLILRIDTYYDSATADISQGIAGLKFLDPFLFGSEYTLVEDLRFQRLDLSTQEFDLDRLSLASYAHRNLEDGLSYSVGHTILQENLDNVSKDAVIGKHDTGIVDISFLSGSITLDRRDNPLNPTNGYNLKFDYALATGQLGSDADYHTLGGRASYISPITAISQRWLLAANTRLAAAWTYSDTTSIPISQRFYLGGRRTVRGFRENSLGPRGEAGSVIGGDMLFLNRYLISDALGVHTFLDAGNVFLQDRDAELDHLRLGTGFGVRYLSPIGPVGLDLGHALDEKQGEPSVRLHFSIGSNF